MEPLMSVFSRREEFIKVGYRVLIQGNWSEHSVRIDTYLVTYRSRTGDDYPVWTQSTSGDLDSHTCRRGWFGVRDFVLSLIKSLLVVPR